MGAILLAPLDLLPLLFMSAALHSMPITWIKCIGSEMKMRGCPCRKGEMHLASSSISMLY
jgi:hypothetical protein